MSDQDFEAQVNGVSLLAEPVRRALYEYVVAQPEPAGRVQAAEATGVAEHTAKFHLDKLVEEGLLTTEFRRLSGRTGPGAGRPSKLYRRSDHQVDLTLPRRQYELASHLLAEAVARSADDGAPVLDSLRGVAHRAGRELAVQPVAGSAAESAAVSAAGAAPTQGTGAQELDAVADTLREHGYEPRRLEHEVLLANCPFHALATRHRDLVCGMNLALLDGVLQGLGCRRTAARLDPAPDRCCVVLAEQQPTG